MKTTGAHIPDEGLMTEEPHFQTANQKWNKANASGRDLETVETQNMNATTRPMTQKEEQKQGFIRKQQDAAGKVAQAENDFYNKSNTNHDYDQDNLRESCRTESGKINKI